MSLDPDGWAAAGAVGQVVYTTWTSAPLMTGIASIPPQRSCLIPPLPFGMPESRLGMESGEPGATLAATLKAALYSFRFEAGESLKAFVRFPFWCKLLDTVSINIEGVSEGVIGVFLGIFSVSSFSSATTSKSGVVNDPEVGFSFDAFPDFPDCFRELMVS